ncbi:hypothetical protein L1987_20739 [Smallanthus sonchifolius]|uniref:Uncharacterized protein n=1 Tax=Smallanthus sonchifolius TaxID=185202 RepID=A0ACB9ISX1_9ASTR|nr:hypothetical protein L1987_20739 [Smallanthus sonchifolius]
MEVPNDSDMMIEEEYSILEAKTYSKEQVDALSTELCSCANIPGMNPISPLEKESDDVAAVQSLGPTHGPYFAILEANDNHHGLHAKFDSGEFINDCYVKS